MNCVFDQNITIDIAVEVLVGILLDGSFEHAKQIGQLIGIASIGMKSRNVVNILIISDNTNLVVVASLDPVLAVREDDGLDMGHDRHVMKGVFLNVFCIVLFIAFLVRNKSSAECPRINIPLEQRMW